METRTVMRVVVNGNDIRKITLRRKPETLDSLVEQLEEKLGLPHKFSLQYEDTDFINALINLTDIADLPERPTLNVFSLVTSPTPSTAATDIIPLFSEEGSTCTPGSVARDIWNPQFSSRHWVQIAPREPSLHERPDTYASSQRHETCRVCVLLQSISLWWWFQWCCICTGQKTSMPHWTGFLHWMERLEEQPKI